MLAIVLLLGAGVFTYRNMPVELFPESDSSGGGGVPELERLVESSVVPALAGVDGALRVVVTGGTETRALVAVTPEALADSGVSLFQVSQALAQNEVALPAGVMLAGGKALPVKAANTIDVTAAAFVSDAVGIISAELATVVIGGLITSTALTLLVVPVVYMLVNDTIPGLFSRQSGRPNQIESS